MHLVSLRRSAPAMTWLPAVICALLIGGAWGRFVVVPARPEDSLTSPIKYVITGQKDSDGHWTEQVQMEHGEEDWHMEVDHMTLEVGKGQPKVKITATFSAKSSPHDAVVLPKSDVLESDVPESDVLESDVPESDVPESEISEPAESGWVFQLFPRSHRDWFEALRQCELWGGHLAVPDSRAKMRELTAILRLHVEDVGETTGAFLGFDDLKREGHFVTVLGKPLFGSRASSWSPRWFQAGQPDNDKTWTKDGEDCGSFRPDGGLNDVPCRYNLPFICEKAALAEVPAEQAVDEEEEDGTTNSVALEHANEATLRLFRHDHVDWYRARTACGEWGGHLAIPDSEAKMLKMAKMLKSTSTSFDEGVSAFVGFNDIKEEGQFVTIFGEPVFSSDAGWSPRWFNPTQPDDDKGWSTEGEDCGAVHPAGGLNDVPCRYLLPYFCEKGARADASNDEDTTPASSDEDVAEENGGEVAHTSAEISLYAHPDLDWFDANEACRDWGGHLAIPDSAEKMEVMTSKMMLANVQSAFLGFSDQEQEGHFVTIFGKPVFSESSWSPHWWRDDQPDDDKSWYPGGEDCGSLKTDGGLNDVPCRHRMAFFCERPSAGVRASTEDEATPVASPDHETYVAAGEELSTSEEKTLLRIIVPYAKTLPDNDETSIMSAVRSSEEPVSVEEALSKLMANIEAILPMLSDSPIDGQNSEDKELSTEEAPWQETEDDPPIAVQGSEEKDSFTEEALSQEIITVQDLASDFTGHPGPYWGR